MTIEQELEMFEKVCMEMTKTFASKRHDYGPTTEETFKKFGPVSMLTRMHDKLGRLDNLLICCVQPEVRSEKVEDTLIDLANYAIITLIELRKADMERTRAVERR